MRLKEEESDFHEIDMMFKTGITEKIWKSHRATEVTYKDNGWERLTVIFKTVSWRPGGAVCSKEKKKTSQTTPAHATSGQVVLDLD